jgi:hypothetical protein
VEGTLRAITREFQEKLKDLRNRLGRRTFVLKPMGRSGEGRNRVWQYALYLDGQTTACAVGRGWSDVVARLNTVDSALRRIPPVEVREKRSRFGPLEPKASRAQPRLKQLLHEAQVERGLENERAVFEALCDLPAKLRPPWFQGVRRGTPEEDRSGIDIIVDSDLGPLYIQVKSSDHKAEFFQRRHADEERLIGVLAVIKKSRFDRGTLRNQALLLATQLYTAMSHARCTAGSSTREPSA